MADGLFDLKTPEDLLAKLEREYNRLKSDPVDTDTAYNFFVTADSILDWLQQDGRAKMVKKSDDSRTKLCLSLSVGAKHFTPKRRHSKAVRSTNLRHAVFEKGIFEQGIFEEGALLIHHEEKEFPTPIEAIDLATRVLDFWKQHPAFKRA